MSSKSDRITQKSSNMMPSKLVVDHGHTCLKVSRRLGIASCNVTRWVRLHRQDQGGLCESGVTRRDLETENRRLKKENKRLEVERQILKKAAAFFAKESNCGTTLSSEKSMPIPSPFINFLPELLLNWKYLSTSDSTTRIVYLNIAKVGGLQSRGVKGEDV